MITLIDKVKSNKEEVQKANEYNSISTFNIYAPGGSDGRDPDIIIKKNNINYGLEYKKDKNCRMENPSIKFNNGIASAKTELGIWLANYINENSLYTDFYNETGIENISQTTGIYLEKALKLYAKGRTTGVIDKFDIEDFDGFTKRYYANKNCHYMQVGDNFYRLSDIDPLDFGLDIPLIRFEGTFSCRFNFDVKFNKKGAGKWNYPKAYNDYMKLLPDCNSQSQQYKEYRANWKFNEGGDFSMRILPEATPNNKSFIDSNYSLEINTNKINPLK